MQTSRGITLIELLVVIAIIAILAAIVVLIVNPLELTRQARDAIRIRDLDELQRALNANITSSSLGLCKGIPIPCSGRSNDGLPEVTRKNDGTGWVKYDFKNSNSVSFSVLPLDPTNDNTNYYAFYSDGLNFEINTLLESEKNKNKMLLDGGSNANKYEVGSNTLLDP